MSNLLYSPTFSKAMIVLDIVRHLTPSGEKATEGKHTYDLSDVVVFGFNTGAVQGLHFETKDKTRQANVVGDLHTEGIIFNWGGRSDYNPYSAHAFESATRADFAEGEYYLLAKCVASWLFHGGIQADILKTRIQDDGTAEQVCHGA